MTIEEAIKHYEESERDNRIVAGICVSPMAKNHSLENAEKCRQMITWLKILKKAKFEYDEAWRIITHPTPDVTPYDKNRAQVILETFRGSLGKIEYES